MPRKTGVSGRTVDWPILRRPSERSVPRCVLFPPGGEVTPKALADGGAVRRGELVKVLGNGDLTVALRVSAHAVSSSARQKIEAAGGTVTLLG